MPPSPSPVPLVLGVDPSAEYTGLAVVHRGADARVSLVALDAVIMFAGNATRSVVERIHPWIDARVFPGAAIWTERPPPTARADTGHGAQAAIGDSIGWVGGLIAGRYLATCRVHRVLPTDWRRSMLLEAARAGLLLGDPSRVTPPKEGAPLRPGMRAKVDRGTAPGELVRSWSGCDHSQRFVDYASLTLSSATSCPDCAALPAPRWDRAGAVRAAWKQAACRWVEHRWPDAYAELVEGARARSKVTKAAWELGGVADACEAVGIAVHGLQEGA